MEEKNIKKQEIPEVKDYFQFNELFTYFFRKKDPNRKTNFSIRTMHWINKISIMVFLVTVIILVVRHLF